MAFSINDIKSQLEFGGARPSLFQVQFNNPVNSSAARKIPFLCRASSIPSSNLGIIEVPYFGRKVKISGDRTFEDWSVTVINDEDFLIRNSLEQWMAAINTHQGNLRNFSTGSPQEYKTDANVVQYAKTGEIIRSYIFHGLWPSVISPITLDWSTTDTLEEFDVTFQYDWWEVDPTAGNNVGGLMNTVVGAIGGLGV